MKRVEVAITYLFSYSFDELEGQFDDLKTDEEYERAAYIMLLNEDMNECEPNDIEVEVRRDN
jgi:hypothetical protein